MTKLTDFRRSRRRDDVGWFYECSLRSLRSLGVSGTLLIELGHSDPSATGLLAVGAADPPTPGAPNTSLPAL